MGYTITLIPGDGVGPEITEATCRVVEALDVGISWDVQEAGLHVFEADRGTVAAVRDRLVAPEQSGD